MISDGIGDGACGTVKTRIAKTAIYDLAVHASVASRTQTLAFGAAQLNTSAAVQTTVVARINGRLAERARVAEWTRAQERVRLVQA